MKPISTRLPDWLRAKVAEESRAYGEGPSEALRRVVKEWWVHKELEHLEFRDSPLGRRAAVRGGPEVWEVVSVWRDYEDPAAFREHFGWLPPEALDEAITYSERFEEEIDLLIDTNERLGRYLSERLPA